MMISSMSSANAGLALQRSSSGASASGNSQQVKELEHQKQVLQQKLEKARNRFALSQSDEYKKIKKQLSETEKQLSQAKASERSNKTSEASEVTEAPTAQSAEQSTPHQLTASQRFDSFTHTAESESAGIYKLMQSANGERSVMLDDERKNRLPAGIA